MSPKCVFKLVGINCQEAKESLVKEILWRCYWEKIKCCVVFESSKMFDDLCQEYDEYESVLLEKLREMTESNLVILMRPIEELFFKSSKDWKSIAKESLEKEQSVNSHTDALLSRLWPTYSVYFGSSQDEVMDCLTAQDMKMKGSMAINVGSLNVKDACATLWKKIKNLD